MIIEENLMKLNVIESKVYSMLSYSIPNNWNVI